MSTPEFDEGADDAELDVDLEEVDLDDLSTLDEEDNELDDSGDDLDGDLDEDPPVVGGADDEADDATSDEDAEDAEDDEDDEDDEAEESLDVLLAREKVLDEDDLGRIAEESRDVLSVRPALVGAGEFTCRSCFLVKRRAQLANEKRLLCFDCA